MMDRIVFAVLAVVSLLLLVSYLSERVKRKVAEADDELADQARAAESNRRREAEEAVTRLNAKLVAAEDSLKAEKEAARAEIALLNSIRESQGAKIVSARAELERLNRQRVPWAKPVGQMSASDVRTQFNVPITDPFFAAFMQELDDAYCDLLDSVTGEPSAALTAESRTHAAGMAEGLRKFQRQILDLQAAAAKDDQETE